MKKKQGTRKIDKGFSLLISIILVFCILGAVVFSVSRKISVEMSDSAIQNLSESLNLIKSTIEAILNKEAEFQKLMAQELASAENPEAHLCSYGGSQTMVKVSMIRAGENEGISDNGEVFTQEELDFSAGREVDGVAVSQSYVNYMGTWAYTMKCPVIKDGEEVAMLYVEYIYDSLDRSLPAGFYNKKAMLYIMDAQTERLVLKPKGMGQRDAGHLNLEDFYRANDIRDEELMAEVNTCLKEGKNIMFNHDIRGKKALNYMWSVNGGSIYLIGYVPIDAIQQEGTTVNQNIYIVVIVMLTAFFLCCLLYYFNQRQQSRIRKEQEAEREIYNRQLAEALQAAQAASNSKTTFLSNMSHDIRTPMNAVLGFTMLLERDAQDPDKVREYTKKIMASGQHLLSLINDILDVSKIESGKVVLSVEEFTLNDLVSSVDAIIRPMAKAREQKFFVTVTGVRHEYLLGDETRINQILINLLSNAVKYTPAGGNIWFRIIGRGQRSSQFEHIRIEVEDDGYGMTPEYLERIFDAFTRAENSTTNKVQGTGLGMAITKNIVELMGGTIDVSSEVDKGSIFRVDLEFRIPEGQADRQFWKESGIFRMLALGGGQSGESIQALMEDMDVAVDLVQSTGEALRLLQSSDIGAEGYQLVLLDCDLPDIDAVEAAGRIRALLPEAPILFLKEYEEGEEDRASEIEKAGMMFKPFFVSVLKEKVRKIQDAGKADEDAEKAQEDSLKGMNFLAAEDNEINAEILREILSMENASCEIVENGKLAVERFAACRAGEFDAILMDVQMPVMNGYEATRAIRALEREDAGEIPIIAMTANAFAEDEKEALRAGMDVHLAKPVNVELLKQIVRQYVIKK
ncbi:MAG: response regulator [Lachnospiraceae bacterium]|nr:response regulator [Lachnospiraceae bacterium]MCI9202784.1 response regulator [Lachnospiraceae bacterium]